MYQEKTEETFQGAESSDDDMLDIKSSSVWCHNLCLDEVMPRLEGSMESQPGLDDLIRILHRCRKERDLSSALQLHKLLHQWGLESHYPIGNYIIPVLVEVGCMSCAQNLFNKLEYRNEFSWTCLMTGYIKCGHPQYALSLFHKLQEDESVQANGYTFVSALQACTNLQDIETGSEIHAEIAQNPVLRKDIFIGNTLVDMYAKCGFLTKAQEVFNNLPVRDVVSWNALASGYLQQGKGEEALICLRTMQNQGGFPDAISYMCILKSCGSIASASEGKETHAEMIKKGLLDKDPLLGNALVYMYAKCGLLLEAQEIFDRLLTCDVVSWTTIITGYADHGYSKEALSCFEQMQSQGVHPNAITFISVLKACMDIGAIEKGQAIHMRVDKEGLLENHVLVGSTLVAMYSKCGSPTKAREVFDKLPERDAFSWTALIAGYEEIGDYHQALNCFHQMQLDGIFPDVVTYVSILRSYGALGATEKGLEIHSLMVKKGCLEIDHIIGNALVDFYSKCGACMDAQKVFDNLSIRDVISWTALIAGYAQCAESEVVFSTFDRMIEHGVAPTLVTFVIIINACCHAGLVDRGENYFRMSKDCGIIPTLEIYTCMIDLFSRAGQFDKTLIMIKEMPYQADLAVWRIILGACQKWGNVELGRWAFENAMHLDDKEAVAYVCMCNIYLDAGMHQDAEEIMAMQKQKQLMVSSVDISGES